MIIDHPKLLNGRIYTTNIHYEDDDRLLVVGDKILHKGTQKGIYIITRIKYVSLKLCRVQMEKFTLQILNNREKMGL